VVLVTDPVLLVVAVEAEADAVAEHLPAGVPAEVLVGGFGPVAAAVSTARRLAREPFGAVLSAGIAGALDGRCALRQPVLGTRAVAADLGAESPDGFVPADRLGFGVGAAEAAPSLLAAARGALPDAAAGDILTVSTATGTAITAERLAAAHPHAVAEAMEGFGVASAAAAYGLPFLEIRAVSNLVGTRDRSGWDVAGALGALGPTVAAVLRAVGAAR
jgi:futalosine hydrolase